VPGNPVEGGSRNPVDHVAAFAMRFTFRSVQKRHASLRTPRSTSVIVGQTGNFAIREADSLVDRSPTCHSSRKYFPIARQVYTLRIMHLESSEPMAGSCMPQMRLAPNQMRQLRVGLASSGFQLPESDDGFFEGRIPMESRGARRTAAE
jgi:hypothetical protein